MQRSVIPKELSAASATLLLAGLGAWTTACEEQSEPPKVQTEYLLPALSFAGVDATYAFRRIAAEAGLLLFLDEFRPENIEEQDLGFVRVDADFEAGPVGDVLAAMREQTNAVFDYRTEDGVLFVRSQQSLNEQTILDEKIFPAVHFEKNFNELLLWMLQAAPMTMIGAGDTYGQPTLIKVELDIPANSSVIDVMTIYAKTTGKSIRIQRAGYEYKPGGPGRFVSNAIGLWSTLDGPQTLPRQRLPGSVTYTLAAVQEQTGATICVFDRSVLGDARGALDYAESLYDSGWKIKTAIIRLAKAGASHPRVPKIYTWEELAGIWAVRSNKYNFFLTGQDLMDQHVNGGTFEGTLGHLARWLNANRKEPSHKVFVGGEIRPHWARVRMEIEDGTRVEDALYQFARESGEGWSIVVKDSKSPRVTLEGTWSGVYLTRLADWGPRGEGFEEALAEPLLEHADDVADDEEVR